MTESTGIMAAVEVTPAAQSELRRVLAEKENQGRVVRVVFRGFG